MFRLWIEERDKEVWHWAMRYVGSLTYEAACGWELSVRRGRVWPQKVGDPGPPHEDRCHTCADIEQRTQGGVTVIPIETTEEVSH